MESPDVVNMLSFINHILWLTVAWIARRRSSFLDINVLVDYSNNMVQTKTA